MASQESTELALGMVAVNMAQGDPKAIDTRKLAETAEVKQRLEEMFSDDDDDLLDDSTPQSDFMFASDEGNNEDAAVQDELEEQQVCCGSIRKLPWMSRFLCVLLLGAVVLIAPAAILLGLNPDEYNPDLRNPITDTSKQLNSFNQLVRWSIFLCCEWMVVVVAWHFVHSLPYTIQKALEWLYGNCTEETRSNLDMIPALRSWLTFAISMVIGLILYSIVFYQQQQVPLWNSFFNAILFFTILSVCLLVQRFVVQLIAIDFHRVSYADRIRTSRREIKALDKLRKSIRTIGLTDIFDIEQMLNVTDKKPPTKWNVFAINKHVEEKDLNKHGKTSITSPFGSDEIPQIDPVSSPAAAPPKTVNTITSPTDSSPLSVKLEAKETNGPRKSATIPRKRGLHHAISRKILSAVTIGGSKYSKKVKTMNILSESHAVKLSKKLFASLGGRHDKELTIDSFVPYFKTHAAASEAFQLFDTDRNGSLSDKEMKHAVLRIYRDRRNLYASLRDLSQALGHLNKILYVFSAILSLLLFLPLYGVSLSSLLPFITLAATFSFIFGGSLKNTFDCIVFLFMTHAYDTGDLIMLEGVQGTLKVVELNLLNTLFEKGDGQRVLAPNSVLSTKLITNIRRSGDQSESVDLYFDLGTSKEKLHDLHAKMLEFVRSESRDFLPHCDLLLNDFADGHSVRCSISIKYKGNWQDSGQRWTRRNKFMHQLKDTVKDLGIVFAPKK